MHVAMVALLGLVLVVVPAAGKIELVLAHGVKEPFAVDFDKAGAMVVAEMGGHGVTLVDKAGRVTKLAGTGEKGLSGDGGPAASAEFGGIYCLAIDPQGERLYLCDLDSRRIRAMSFKTGVVTTVAGNGKKGVPKDGGAALEEPLVDPRAIAVDSKGNLYICERSGNALRVVDAAGRIRTVAGTGKPGLSGDGGPALQATMSGPKHLMCDAADDVLISDTETHTIRKYVAKEGRIVRVAGTGKKGAAGVGGAAEQCELARPHGAYVHPSGALYISDSDNHRILVVR